MKIQHVAIVSLSSGILGESFVKHEVEIGLKRLSSYGLDVTFMPHTLCGLDYIKDHPEDRAADLLAALKDESIDLILCAIGGDDTYRLLPYLFEHDELEEAVRNLKKEKYFLGFSDTTVNHLMFHKVGLTTFYGQAFLTEVCELEEEMLSYSKEYFEELIQTGTIKKITPSPDFYDDRTDWSAAAIGTPRIRHTNEGFKLLQGPARFSGEILGGCVETLFDLFDNTRYEDSVQLCQKYQLFPMLETWKGKILLLETSESKSEPSHYRKMLTTLKKAGIFEVINGIICGKPIDNLYQEEYHQILMEVVGNPELPILANVSVGHCAPRCIMPLGIPCTVDADKDEIRFY